MLTLHYYLICISHFGQVSNIRQNVQLFQYIEAALRIIVAYAANLAL